MNTINYAQLYRCYLNCRRNKRNTLNQLAFESNAELNLLRLQDELNRRTYRPGRSICFVLRQPKLREVFAADFRDRVVHHVLIEHLGALCEPRFIYDSCACRPGKGTHHAALRLQTFTRQATANNQRRAYFLQLDIRSFFVEINKNILLEIVRRQTDVEQMLWLAETIIRNDPTQNCRITRGENLLSQIPAHKTLFKAPKHKGLPIGNLTSQFFANLYLNELDQYVKRVLKCRWYVRYMDDMVLLAEHIEQLGEWMVKIERFLAERLDLRLHPTKRLIGPVSNGIDFVGYIIRPAYLLVRKRIIGNLRRKIWTGQIDRKRWSSYQGHFKFAQTKRLCDGLADMLVANGLSGALSEKEWSRICPI
jgi:RNA-directed DNA polymerase